VSNHALKTPRTPDFNDIPIIDYDLCYPKDDFYVGNEPHIAWPEMISLWSRGCPHHCLFCSNPVFGHQKARLMSPERVYEEMSIMKKRHIKSVFVYSDELIGMGPECDRWLESVCQKIAPLKLLYKTQGRCSRKHDISTFEAMAAAGFKVIMWGVESFSPKILKNFKKGTEPEDIWHSLALSHKVGIKNFAFLIVGGIDETEDDFNMTLEGVRRGRDEGLIDFGQASIMTAEPGAPLFEIAKKNGWLPGESVRATHSHIDPYLNVPWASHDELTRRQNLLYEALC